LFTKSHKLITNFVAVLAHVACLDKVRSGAYPDKEL